MSSGSSLADSRMMPDDLTKERLRNAVRQSFYACTDSVFFDESMSEDDHEKMLDRVRAICHS